MGKSSGGGSVIAHVQVGINTLIQGARKEAIAE